jgi:hypothetical protein
MNAATTLNYAPTTDTTHNKPRQPGQRGVEQRAIRARIAWETAEKATIGRTGKDRWGATVDAWWLGTVAAA